MDKVRSLFCLECEKNFGPELQYWAQDKCNRCYQRLYLAGKIKLLDPLKKKSTKPTHCIECNLEFLTLNERGRLVRRGQSGHCKSCFHKKNRPTTICKNCNTQMLKSTITGLCHLCRIEKGVANGSRTYKNKVNNPIDVDYENYELIRRLLVRYKLGINSPVDEFRVVDFYLYIKEAPAFLDTLTERIQVIEMLKTLKETFDYNLKLRNEESKKQPSKNKFYIKKYSKQWYEKSSKSYKNKCK
jgi:hypothetical protein